MGGNRSFVCNRKGMNPCCPGLRIRIECRTSKLNPPAHFLRDIWSTRCQRTLDADADECAAARASLEIAASPFIDDHCADMATIEQIVQPQGRVNASLPDLCAKSRVH